MGRLNRKTVVSSAITAGLLLAPATATLAADPRAHSNAGGSEAGQAHAAAGQADAAENKAAAGDSGSSSGGGSSGGSGAPAAQPDNRPGPPGNNGTIKIDGVDFDSHPNNEPHVDCIFEIDFYGFDANQPVSVAFALQAPTTGGTITGTSPSGMTLDGDDNSFGGSERGLDGSLRYTLGFTGVTPHPKHGYHVKVTVHAPGANGADVKHKVFWVEPCGGGPITTTTTTSSTTSSTTSTSSTSTTSTTSTTTTTIAGGGGGSTSVGGTDLQNRTSTVTPVVSRVAVLGEVIERTPAAPTAVAPAPAVVGLNADNTARVLGTTVERAALARTGLDALQLITLGALTLLAGIAAVRASRRKDTIAPRFTV